MTFLNFW